MTAPSSDSILPGVLIVIILLPVLYAIGRGGKALGDVWSAHLLSPLAPIINGHMERSHCRLVGTYEGWPVQVFVEPQRSVGVFAERTSATSRMNAFSIAIPDLPGRGGLAASVPHYRYAGAGGTGARIRDGQRAAARTPRAGRRDC